MSVGFVFRASQYVQFGELVGSPCWMLPLRGSGTSEGTGVQFQFWAGFFRLRMEIFGSTRPGQQVSSVESVHCHVA